MASLLELVKQVVDELGLPAVTGVVGSSQPTTRQVLALMTRFGNDLVRKRDWQQLVREHVVQTEALARNDILTAGSTTIDVDTTAGVGVGWLVSGEGLHPNTEIVGVNGNTQFVINMPAFADGPYDLVYSKVSYPLPTDWKNQVNQTEWDRTNQWPMGGPQTAQAWQVYKIGAIYSGIRQNFRILGNAIKLASPPPSGLLFSYEYISKNWVKDVSGNFKPAFTVDSDTCVFDDSLMVLGTKVLFLQAKGLDPSMEVSQFNNLLAQTEAQDAGAPALSFNARRGRRWLDGCNIPGGGWGGGWPGGGGGGPTDPVGYLVTESGNFINV